jgi:hypothetical protein
VKILIVQRLHSPVTSSFFGPNILLRTLISNTHNLCSSLNVRDQVSHPYKTTCRIMVLYASTFTFLDSRWMKNSYICEISSSHGGKYTDFWDLDLCSLVEVDRRFRRSYYLHHQIDYRPETSVSFHESTWRYIPQGCNLRHLYKCIIPSRVFSVCHGIDQIAVSVTL